MSFSVDTPFRVKHVLRAEQFDRPFLEYLFRLTDSIRKFAKSPQGLRYLHGLLSHRRAMLYFTQPSTRTFLSFQSACHILGVNSSEIRDPATSSERKGESIEDSLRTFASYVDLIIMRTPVPGLCDKIADLIDKTPRPIPVINAGSGPDQHPTQALLDMYTLAKSFEMRAEDRGIDGKTVIMVGDLKRGRTIRSLAKLLAHFQDVKIIFVGPKEFSVEADVKQFLSDRKCLFYETENFEEALPQADAVYMTRVQDEYDSVEGSSKKVNIEKYFLTRENIRLLNKNAVILHPLPRRQELDPFIDQDPRAVYWRQERNGMWTRVAIIAMIFGIDHTIHMPELM